MNNDIRTLDTTMLARDEVPAAFLKSFHFKAVKPIFDLHPFRLYGQPEADGKSAKLWAQDHAGGLNMQGGAELA